MYDYLKQRTLQSMKNLNLRKKRSLNPKIMRNQNLKPVIQIFQKKILDFILIMVFIAPAPAPVGPPGRRTRKIHNSSLNIILTFEIRIPHSAT